MNKINKKKINKTKFKAPFIISSETESEIQIYTQQMKWNKPTG